MEILACVHEAGGWRMAGPWLGAAGEDGRPTFALAPSSAVSSVATTRRCISLCVCGVDSVQRPSHPRVSTCVAPPPQRLVGWPPPPRDAWPRVRGMIVGGTRLEHRACACVRGMSVDGDTSLGAAGAQGVDLVDEQQRAFVVA